MNTTYTTEDTANSDALVERLFQSTIGAMDLFSVYLGDRLGYYRALAQTGPATSGELADRSGTHERYAREWLEQQAVTGFLDVDDSAGEPHARRYRLPDAYRDVFSDPDSLSTMVPLAQIFAGCVAPLPAIVAAFQTGGGVPYEDYGADLVDGQAGTTRPQFKHLLVQEWIAAMPDIDARLRSEPGARIADIGMGLGWSSIALAEGFTHATVDGFDTDEASVVKARKNASESGVADRVTFHARAAGAMEEAGSYDFAIAVECVHDMSDPVGALQSMRRLVGDGGTVLVVDEKVQDRFVAPGDDVERYMYGFSILHCLPAGMAEAPSEATGTVMRSDTLRDYAQRAGFTSVEILPVENDFFRFYRLTA